MKQIPWREQYADINGMHIRYHRTGGNKPPIILLHGISDNGLCWTRVAKDLENKHDLIMMDARGHGRSTTPEMDFGFELMADDVAGLIANLNLTKPVLLGHSMGGQVATFTAGKYPDLVSKIILEDPAYFMKKRYKFLLKMILPLFLWSAKKNAKKSQEQIRKGCKKLHPTWVDDDVEPWVVAQQEFGKNLKELKLNTIFLDVHWHETFAKVRCPVLLIIPSGGMMSLDQAKAVQQEFTDARLVHVHDAGHNVRREQYEEYMEAVREFLHDKT